MTRLQAWTLILIGALAVAVCYSMDAAWQTEAQNRALLARIWEDEAEITDLTTMVRGARDDVRQLRERLSAIERQVEDDREAQLPTEESWGTGSMGDARIWDSHLESTAPVFPVLVLNSDCSMRVLSLPR